MGCCATARGRAARDVLALGGRRHGLSVSGLPSPGTCGAHPIGTRGADWPRCRDGAGPGAGRSDKAWGCGCSAETGEARAAMGDQAASVAQTGDGAEAKGLGRVWRRTWGTCGWWACGHLAVC